MRRDIERLRDILEAVAAIERYTQAGRSAFDRDELIQVWCLRHLEVIGEAAARLSEELRAQYPIAPWRDIVAMRNLLIHGYFDVDWEEVWNVVEKNLSDLKTAVREILSKEGG